MRDGRVSTAGGATSVTVMLSGARLAPQRFAQAVQRRFGRGIDRRAGCGRERIARADDDDRSLSRAPQPGQKSADQMDRAVELERTSAVRSWFCRISEVKSTGRNPPALLISRSIAG